VGFVNEKNQFKMANEINQMGDNNCCRVDYDDRNYLITMTWNGGEKPNFGVFKIDVLGLEKVVVG
jgi:beta-xylosidase